MAANGNTISTRRPPSSRLQWTGVRLPADQAIDDRQAQSRMRIAAACRIEPHERHRHAFDRVIRNPGALILDGQAPAFLRAAVATYTGGSP
jgi:hypothetical protein